MSAALVAGDVDYSTSPAVQLTLVPIEAASITKIVHALAASCRHETLYITDVDGGHWTVVMADPLRSIANHLAVYQDTPTVRQRIARWGEPPADVEQIPLERIASICF